MEIFAYNHTIQSCGSRGTNKNTRQLYNSINSMAYIFRFYYLNRLKTKKQTHKLSVGL